MASSDRRFAVDTSFALALLTEANPLHEAATAAAASHVLALAGHAAFETYAVLTRGPHHLRLDPAVASELLQAAFPEWCTLSARGANRLLPRLGELGIVGGSVYDALVAAAAAENDRLLLSADRRADATYRKLAVSYELIAP